MSDQTIVPRCGRPTGENPLDNLLELVVQRLILAQDVAAVRACLRSAGWDASYGMTSSRPSS
jgi:hypothetical protein